jgi:hypothetical protein
MIGFFPDPYPDELLYSACARYARQTKYQNSTHAVEELFGSHHITVMVDLPCYLERLIQALPFGHAYTTDLILDKHTLLPFYAPFIAPDRFELVRGEMLGASGHVYARMGLTACGVKWTKRLRFCPECAREDRENFGETYWHRIHQVTGVEVCPQHEAFLEDSAAQCRQRRYYGQLIAAETSVPVVATRRLCSSSDEHSLLLRITRAARWLLDRPATPLDGLPLRERYYQLLLERGYADYGGRNKAGELASAITRFYTPDLLARLHCPLSHHRNYWVKNLLKASEADSMHHPLRHILLTTFMGMSVEEVFNHEDEYKPFGAGPWLCINRAADHYLQACVTDCRIENASKSNAGKPMGRFSCSCGFVYTRLGPDLTDADRSNISSVQAFGDQWEALLRQLWYDPSVTLYAAAKRLGVSQLTVTRRAIYLGLDFPRKDAHARRASGVILERYRVRTKGWFERREERRAKFLAVRRAHPDADRRRLRELLPYALEWLQRHDLEWLSAQMPARQKKLPPQRNQPVWAEIDVKLAAGVREEAARLRSLSGAPVRVSLAAIIRALNRHVWLERRLDKLPCTKDALAEFLESMVAFNLRRVEWALQCYRRDGTIPSRSAFIGRAGIKNKAGKADVVQNAVDEALNLLGVGSGSE